MSTGQLSSEETSSRKNVSPPELMKNGTCVFIIFCCMMRIQDVLPKLRSPKFRQSQQGRQHQTFFNWTSIQDFFSLIGLQYIATKKPPPFFSSAPKQPFHRCFHWARVFRPPNGAALGFFSQLPKNSQRRHLAMWCLGGNLYEPRKNPWLVGLFFGG